MPQVTFKTLLMYRSRAYQWTSKS